MSNTLYNLIDEDESLSDAEKREIYFENLAALEELRELDESNSL